MGLFSILLFLFVFGFFGDGFLCFCNLEVIFVLFMAFFFRLKRFKIDNFFLLLLNKIGIFFFWSSLLVW